MVCLPWADSDQCFNISDAYFRWLFRMTVSDHCSRWLFRMPVSHEYSGLLFRMTISDAYSRWLFQMTVSDYSCRWFTVPMLVRNSTADSYFNKSFDWLVPRLIRFWTTALYCRIMAPIPPDKMGFLEYVHLINILKRKTD